MKELPEAVRETLDRLRSEHEHYIRVRPKNGHFYVVEYISKYDPLLGASKKLTKHLGRITPDGTFIPAKRRAEGIHTEGAQKLQENIRHVINNLKEEQKNLHVIKVGKTVYVYAIEEKKLPRYIGWISDDAIFHGPEEPVIEKGMPVKMTKDVIERDRKFIEYDEKILMILSMNSRAPASLIAQKTGLSKQEVEYRIKKLESRYGIKYLTQFDTDEQSGTIIGYSTYIVLVKFDQNIPKIEDLREMLQGQPKIQLAVATKGAYDLLMYFLEETSDKAIDFIWKLRSRTRLKKYAATWYVSPVSRNYGFIPLRDEFFDSVLIAKVWKRSKETPSPLLGQLSNREFVVVRELNKNSNTDFAKIDRDNGFDPGASRYTYYKLKDRGIIIRPTITLTKLPIKYVGLVLLTYESGEKYAEARPNLLKEVIAETPLINKYAYEGDIGAPTSILMIMPVFKEGELDRALEYLRANVKGVIPSSLIATDILAGHFCYRRFDNEFSRQYRLLSEEFKILPQKRKEAYE